MMYYYSITSRSWREKNNWMRLLTVDRNLIKNYNVQEVEMMIKVALLCTQPSPEERPTMSEVVRMLEGEGLAERWEEWKHLEVNRRHEYERMQRRYYWAEDSVHNQEAIELSCGRWEIH